jgi:hypothetical protein
MGNLTLLFVVILTILAVVVAIVSRKLRESSKSKEEDGSGKRESWISQIHSVWWMAGAGLGALKYIWKAWKTAPDGSPAKFGWGALLALIAAIALFAIVRLIDNKLNPPQNGDEVETQRDAAPTTYTYGRMTDKWEYRR